MEQIALHTHWPAANRKMVAKLISELAYEQAFKIEQNNQGYVLRLDDGVCYQFLGKTNIWGQIVIEPTSLIRKQKSLNSDVLATQFMMDVQRVINIGDESLAEHFEDLNATLLGDCKLAQRKMNISANGLAFFIM